MIDTTEYFEYGLVFLKQWESRLVSHLDLMRLLARAMRRTNLPLYFSQGFNPRPKLSYLSQPLPLGATSECEIASFRTMKPFEQGKLLELLAACFPPGIVPGEITHEHKKIKNVSIIKYLLLLDRTPEDGLIAEVLGESLASDAQFPIDRTDECRIFVEPGRNAADLFPVAREIRLTHKAEGSSPVKKLSETLVGAGYAFHFHRWNYE